jgi:hypothetical protein
MLFNIDAHRLACFDVNLDERESISPTLLSFFDRTYRHTV